jgi:hypothetical protein
MNRAATAAGLPCGTIRMALFAFVVTLDVSRKGGVPIFLVFALHVQRIAYDDARLAPWPWICST